MAGSWSLGGGGHWGTRVSSTEILDPTTMQWSAGPDLAAARSSTTATILPDGKIIVAGGRSAGGAALSSTEVLATGVPTAPPLPDGPVVIAPVPDCSDMRPAEIAVHLESWLTAAELVKADPEQALETGRTKIRATHDQTVGASRARKDLALQAAQALRDREIAEARQTFNAASTVVTQQHQTVQNAAHRLQDRHLGEFAARAGAELAKLLPEIDRVRSEKEDAAKMVASFKRRSDSGAASASKRPRQEAAPATPECWANHRVTRYR